MPDLWITGVMWTELKGTFVSSDEVKGTFLPPDARKVPFSSRAAGRGGR
jgi:hypothetical protein